MPLPDVYCKSPKYDQGVGCLKMPEISTPGSYSAHAVNWHEQEVHNANYYPIRTTNTKKIDTLACFFMFNLFIYFICFKANFCPSNTNRVKLKQLG